MISGWAGSGLRYGGNDARTRGLCALCFISSFFASPCTRNVILFVIISTHVDVSTSIELEQHTVV